MRVLLIDTNRKADLLAAPPLGLAYVAGAAAAAGHEVRVRDLCFLPPPQAKGQLEKTVKHSNPQAVGLSVRDLDNCNLLHPVSNLPEVRAIAAGLRRLTSAPLVVGGHGGPPHPVGAPRRGARHRLSSLSRLGFFRTAPHGPAAHPQTMKSFLAAGFSLRRHRLESLCHPIYGTFHNRLMQME
ncbi:MAG: hypothetical protein FJ126_03225 [Deltaproteobacteria bacterium]|nr:hypothetical protein [Deltaproteobacteria bacterium]